MVDAHANNQQTDADWAALDGEARKSIALAQIKQLSQKNKITLFDSCNPPSEVEILALAEKWADCNTALSPAQFVQSITKGFPDAHVVLGQSSHYSGAGIKYSFYPQGWFDSSNYINGDIGAAREMGQPVNAHINFFYWSVKKSTGTGSGREALKLHMGFMQRMNVGQVTLDAGSSVGGYFWARVGFIPTHWPSVKEAIKIRINQLKRGEVGKKNKELLDEISEQINQSNDVKTIWALADSHKKYQTSGGQSEKIGEIILRGLVWNAEFSFTDPEQVARYNAYVNASTDSEPKLSQASAQPRRSPKSALQLT
jgi:hypothetical protein